RPARPGDTVPVLDGWLRRPESHASGATRSGTMSAAIEPDFSRAMPFDSLAVARMLGPIFADRSAAADEGDLFVLENYNDLKASGLVEAGVPSDLGGGGAGVGELCAVIRELGHHCGSTALAFSMHTHQV